MSRRMRSFTDLLLPVLLLMTTPASVRLLLRGLRLIELNDRLHAQRVPAQILGMC